MRSVFILAAAALVTACATPAGQLGETDFAWSEVDVARPPSQVYRGLMERARRCAELVYDGQFYPDATTNRIDVSPPAPFRMGHSAWTLGRIDVVAVGSSSHVRVGVLHKYDEPVFGPAGVYRRTMIEAAQNPDLPCDYKPTQG